jgi:hypothetical protein
MKKRILTLTAAVCLLLTLVLSACGGKPTLEEYFNSDAMQTIVSATAEQYEAQGIGVEMYASGDELHYDFTINGLETTEADRETYAQALQETLDASGDSFVDTAAQIKDAVTNEAVTVVVTYLDGAGNELVSQSYSSADA